MFRPACYRKADKESYSFPFSHASPRRVTFSKQLEISLLIDHRIISLSYGRRFHNIPATLLAMYGTQNSQIVDERRHLGTAHGDCSSERTENKECLQRSRRGSRSRPVQRMSVFSVMSHQGLHSRFGVNVSWRWLPISRQALSGGDFVCLYPCYSGDWRTPGTQKPFSVEQGTVHRIQDQLCY